MFSVFSTWTYISNQYGRIETGLFLKMFIEDTNFKYLEKQCNLKYDIQIT